MFVDNLVDLAVLGPCRCHPLLDANSLLKSNESTRFLLVNLHELQRCCEPTLDYDKGLQQSMSKLLSSPVRNPKPTGTVSELEWPA